MVNGSLCLQWTLIKGVLIDLRATILHDQVLVPLVNRVFGIGNQLVNFICESAAIKLMIIGQFIFDFFKFTGLTLM